MEPAVKTVRSEMAHSIAFKPIPPPSPDVDPEAITLLLFYQYVEPVWNKKQHSQAMANVTRIANENNIKGRGRCAPEGLNCTLSGSAKGIRAFCQGLRDWDATFNETDFKFTDGQPKVHGFKSLGLRKVEELVGYGLPGEKAPNLANKISTHLEAEDYHAMLSDTSGNGPETVIVDVRNAYESAIGHFSPPEGGAKLIDPQMRNSHDFPGWLAKPEVQSQLNGKRVMMYCTGGIRCERASALLGDVAAASGGNFKPAGVFELRGGIERYLKTYPEGGAWAGKNYVFDRRQVQVPELKSQEALQADAERIGVLCSSCRTPWDTYRGSAKCPGKPDVFHGMGPNGCGVPVILCPSCEASPEKTAAALCELCRKDCAAPLPSSVNWAAIKAAREEAASNPQKRKVSHESKDDKDNGRDKDDRADDEKAKKRAKKEAKRAKKEAIAKGAKSGNSGDARLFVGKLPLVVEASAVKAMLAHCAKIGGKGSDECVTTPDAADADACTAIEWITDKTTGAFYGSCFAQMASPELASRAASYFAPGSEGASGVGGGSNNTKGKQAKNSTGAGASALTATAAYASLVGRKLRVNVAMPKDGEEWPPAEGFKHLPRPPVM